MENIAECGCYMGPWWGISPPPRCAEHGGPSSAVPRTYPASGTTIPSQWGVIDYGQFRAPEPTPQHTHYHFAQPLSDADVERIARRVAELLREPPTP